MISREHEDELRETEEMLWRAKNSSAIKEIDDANLVGRLSERTAGRRKVAIEILDMAARDSMFDELVIVLRAYHPEASSHYATCDEGCYVCQLLRRAELLQK